MKFDPRWLVGHRVSICRRRKDGETVFSAVITDAEVITEVKGPHHSIGDVYYGYVPDSPTLGAWGRTTQHLARREWGDEIIEDLGVVNDIRRYV